MESLVFYRVILLNFPRYATQIAALVRDRHFASRIYRSDVRARARSHRKSSKSTHSPTALSPEVKATFPWVARSQEIIGNIYENAEIPCARTREIKFRFWRTEYRTMHYQHDGDLVGEHDMSGGNNSGRRTTSPEVERMQFSSLHDKTSYSLRLRVSMG